MIRDLAVFQEGIFKKKSFRPSSFTAFKGRQSLNIMFVMATVIFQALCYVVFLGNLYVQEKFYKKFSVNSTGLTDDGSLSFRYRMRVQNYITYI